MYLFKHGHEGHNNLGGDMCKCSDGEEATTDQITGSDDNLSNKPGQSSSTVVLSSPLVTEAMYMNIWFQLQETCNGPVPGP